MAACLVGESAHDSPPMESSVCKQGGYSTPYGGTRLGVDLVHVLQPCQGSHPVGAGTVMVIPRLRQPFCT